MNGDQMFDEAIKVAKRIIKEKNALQSKLEEKLYNAYCLGFEAGYYQNGQNPYTDSMLKSEWDGGYRSGKRRFKMDEDWAFEEHE